MTRALRIYDPILFFLTLLATGLGLFFVFDAGYARSLAGEKGFIPPEFKSQVIFLGISLVVGYTAARVRPEIWKKRSRVVWILSLLSLLAVEVIGKEMNGAKRWIGVGSFGVQPAEFAKIATVIYLAGVFADRKSWPSKMPRRSFVAWVDAVLPKKLIRAAPAIWVLFAVIVIEKEPDLGTAFIVAATAFAMFAPGGVTRKSMALTIALACFGVFLMVKKEPYRMERVTNHFHRWEARNADDIGFQTVQSEAAMANGGLFGVGIGNGRAKHILPACTTDFVMATVAEETGLVGALAVLAVIGGIVARLLWRARRATDRFSALVITGIASWIGIQACVNYMMANGALPAIGIPLPFISSGGSSLVALWLALGICQRLGVPRPVAVVEEEVSAPDRDRWGHGRPHLSRA